MAQVQNFDEPVTLYRGKDQRPTHSQKEFNEALSEGFTPRYVHQEYPKVVYHDDGTSKKVGSPEEEKAERANGFSDKPHDDHRHLDRPKVQPKAADADGKLAEKEAENDELKERLEDLEGKFQELLAAVSGKGKGKAKADKQDDAG